jgi:hypothetical protein
MARDSELKKLMEEAKLKEEEPKLKEEVKLKEEGAKLKDTDERDIGGKVPCEYCGHPAYIADVDVGFYARNQVYLRNGQQFTVERFTTAYKISPCQAWQRLKKDIAEVARMEAQKRQTGKQ